MGLIRLLIYLVAGYLIYLFVRALFRKTGKTGERSKQDTQGINLLVEDPVCGVYISKETAIHENVDGKEAFFCSRNCADKYISDSNQKD